MRDGFVFGSSDSSDLFGASGKRGMRDSPPRPLAWHAFWHRDLRLSRLRGANAWGEHRCGLPGRPGAEREGAFVNAFPSLNLDNSRRCKKRAKPAAGAGPAPTTGWGAEKRSLESDEP